MMDLDLLSTSSSDIAARSGDWTGSAFTEHRSRSPGY